MAQQPGPSNANPAAQNRKRPAEDVDEPAAAAAAAPGTGQDAAAATAAAAEADDPQDDESSNGTAESGADSSDDTDDVDSDDEDKQDEAQREPQIDPASLESETFENTPPDQIEKVWKDIFNEDEGDKKVRLHVPKVVCDPKPSDNQQVPRGIQSLYNSTATDCALYAMFATNSTFDYLFMDEKARFKDPVSVVRILKDYVVTPLRKIGFVGAKRTIALKLAMQRAGDLDMKSVIGDRKVNEFLDDLMKSTNVDPQFYTVTATGRQPYLLRVKKEAAYALEVEVKVQTIESDADPVPYTSQQLIEQYTLDKGKKLTKPRNLVLHLNRELAKLDKAVPVYPLVNISLLDSMAFVSRKCIICELNHNRVREATLQCHTCFRCDDKHMQLKSCLYCDDCNKEVHEGFGEHISSPIYGPESDEQREITTPDAKVKEARTEDTSDEIGGDPSKIIHGFELYAIICENLTGHVAYVSADVELPRETIEKYSHKFKAENAGQESSTTSQAPAATPNPDATTKPKEQAGAAIAQPDSSQPTDMTSTTSETAIPSEKGRLTVAKPEEEAPVWLIFDPEEVVLEDARGGYNLPQVHTVRNFDDLISSAKSGGFDPLETDPLKQERYRVLCESVALFYRPIINQAIVRKPKPQESPEPANTTEQMDSNDA